MTPGHDSVCRPPRYSPAVAALGALAFGLVQLLLPLAWPLF